ncbi:MAG: YgfZ/GcvT domain-containing protein [Rhodoluna sp.]
MAGVVQGSFANPLIEQRNLSGGSAAVNLGPRGIITVTGPDRLDWLHSLFSQNLKNLKPGQSAEALLLDPNGHIEQVIHFLDDGETSWLVVEEAGRESLLKWLSKMVFRMKVEIADRSDDFTVIGRLLRGDKAEIELAQAAESNGIVLTWVDPWPGVVSGGVRYSRAWPAKWPWVETLVENDDVAAVFDAFEPAGTLAYDSLRIAAHRPRQLGEVDDKALPHEFDWLSTAVHLSKGCYRGQETVAKVHNLGHPPRRLTFLHLDGSGHALPEVGDEIFIDGNPSARGKITSVGQHFEMGPIALALLFRAVPEDASLSVRTSLGDLAASQEVIVPQSAGKANDIPKIPKLLMGGKH